MESSGVTGVGSKSSDAISNEPVDVANGLWGDVVGLLVVGGLEDWEFHSQGQVDGAVLCWVDLQTLHSLASSENMEQVSQQLVEVDKF